VNVIFRLNKIQIMKLNTSLYWFYNDFFYKNFLINDDRRPKSFESYSRCHVISAISVNVNNYWYFLLSIYFSRKRLLFGNTGFNNRDVSKLYKIRFINYENERGRQTEVKFYQILYWKPLEWWNYIIYPSHKLLQNLIWILSYIKSL